MIFHIKNKLFKSPKCLILVMIFIFTAILCMSTDILTVLGLDKDISDIYINEKLSLEILREDVTECLTNAKGRITYSFTNEHHEKVKTFSSYNDEHSIFPVLTRFNDILSLLHIKAVIIEPSILYCMILPKYQELLSKRHFNVSKFSGSRHIITFGIMEQDVSILQQERSIYKFSIMGFKVHFDQAPMIKWMLKQTPVSKVYSFSSHIFYRHKLCTIHVVVFYRRNNYFWHAALDESNEEENLPKEQLLFSKHDGAHEKFSFISLESKMLPIADFYVPSNAHYFLLEVMTSRFVECDVPKADSKLTKDQPGSHPEMSVKQFNKYTRTALRELKQTFHPLLMHLWIWSGTLLGWYRQCDIIPYTTDIDFATWASDVEDLDHIISMLLNNKHTKLRKRYGLLDEALEMQLNCHGLQADIFYLYEIQNGSWNSGHSPENGYYFRYFYPPFTLCSAELLGEKVQVPCEAEDVISAEYGSDWRKPVLSWNYEKSPKNRGPNIQWKKHALKDIVQTY